MGVARGIAKNTTFSLISGISELGMGFITGIMLTRGLGSEQYGLYAYSVWLLTLMGIGTNLGLGEMSRRFIPESIGRQNPREVAGFIQLSLLIRGIAALVICFAVIITSSYWARQSGNINNNMIFVIVALMILPNTFLDSFIAVFKGFQRFDYSLYISLTIYPVRLILIAIFMGLGFDVQEVLLLNLGTFVLGTLFSLFLLRKSVPLKNLFIPSLLSSDARKQALKYSIIVAGMLALGYLISHEAELFFIGLYRAVEDVGFYSLAYKIGGLFGMFPAAFSYVLLPAIAEQFGKGDMEKIKSIYVFSSRYLMMFALPLAIGGIVLADSLVTIIYGSEYGAVIRLLQIISVPIAISGFTGVCNAIIRGINRPSYLLCIIAILSVINIGLCFWLVPRYGTLGAVIASSVILVIPLPMNTIFITKKVGVKWPGRDMIKIASASLLMGALIYFVHNYLNDVLSLAICIPLGLIIYIAAIFIFREIQNQDITILKGFQNSVPSFIRKYYVSVVALMEKAITKKRNVI